MPRFLEATFQATSMDLIVVQLEPLTVMVTCRLLAGLTTTTQVWA